MTTKHTPAPWSTRWVLRGENRLQVAIEFHKEVTVDETTANLKLISAAPDLLDALEELLRLNDARQKGYDLAPNASYKECEMYEKARAAIAKATQ